MICRLNEDGLIDPASQMHFLFHDTVKGTAYPHVHDFYELSLIIGGNMQITVGNHELNLDAGALMLLRPGDVHSRVLAEGSSYVNLAFPARVIDEMFTYTGDERRKQAMLSSDLPPLCRLPTGEALLLRAELQGLNLLPAGNPRAVNSELRILLVKVISKYLLPDPYTSHTGCPLWLELLICDIDDPEHLSWELDDMARRCGKTREHICRSFKKHLGVTPTAYINARRLNYAANLLLHSDLKVIDIAYSSGFRSADRFYHAFKEAYLVPPLEYRHRSSMPNHGVQLPKK